jgi:hypothetical protein
LSSSPRFLKRPSSPGRQEDLVGVKLRVWARSVLGSIWPDIFANVRRRRVGHRADAAIERLQAAGSATTRRGRHFEICFPSPFGRLKGKGRVAFLRASR